MRAARFRSWLPVQIAKPISLLPPVLGGRDYRGLSYGRLCAGGHDLHLWSKYMEKRVRTGSVRLLVYGLLMQQIGHSKRPQVAAGKDGALRVIGSIEGQSSKMSGHQ